MLISQASQVAYWVSYLHHTPTQATIRNDFDAETRSRATLVPRWTIVEVTVQPAQDAVRVERVQLGVRMESSMVKVLKGLAEFEDVTLGELLEKIVLHSFEPVVGQEGEMAASPHSKRALAAIEDLKRVYGMDFDSHGLRRVIESRPTGALTST
jgi:hypothetical protein